MKTILLATDFSSAAQNATDYAVELANYFGAKLVLVNAHEDEYHGSLASFERFALKDKEAVEELEKTKKEILSKHKLDIECYVNAGFAFDVIQGACDRFHAELVVIGITGKAGIVKEHFVGSTALEVARQLDVNAIIIPENVKYHKVHKVSFACDLERTDESDLVYMAKYFSKIFDAKLEIINVEKNTENSEEKKRTLDEINTKLDSIEHNTVVLKDPNPAEALEHYFESHETDMLMVSPKKHSFFHKLFHPSVTSKLAFHVHHPLLIIH